MTTLNEPLARMLTPFEFTSHTRVVFGPNALAQLGELARDLGFTRTLLVAAVTDKR